jgi:hypothetical protein
MKNFDTNKLCKPTINTKGKYIYYAEGGGMKMLRGGTEIFSGIKGGALKVLDILKGGL